MSTISNASTKASLPNGNFVGQTIFVICSDEKFLIPESELAGDDDYEIEEGLGATLLWNGYDWYVISFAKP